MRCENCKILSCLVVLFSVFVYGAGKEITAYQITASLPQPSYKLGDPIIARVSLKNISNDKIVVGRAISPQQAEVSYKIRVTDESGQEVRLKSSVRQPGQISKPTFFDRASVDLAPNETLEEDCVLTDLLVLNKPGKYILEFARLVPGSNSTYIHSNRLTFTISK
jgi:hypothetical protein